MDITQAGARRRRLPRERLSVCLPLPVLAAYLAAGHLGEVVVVRSLGDAAVVLGAAGAAGFWLDRFPRPTSVIHSAGRGAGAALLSLPLIAAVQIAADAVTSLGHGPAVGTPDSATTWLFTLAAGMVWSCLGTWFTLVPAGALAGALTRVSLSR